MSFSFFQLKGRYATRLVAMLGVGAALLLASGWQARAADQMPYGKGLQWKIERAGVAPSHVFGTIHSTDKRVSRLPKPVQKVV